MTPLKRNLSRLFIFFLVLFLSATIFGFVYFFKMERSEDILNTLYFRELQQIENGIQRSIEKVNKTGSYTLSFWRKETDKSDEFFNQAGEKFKDLASSAQELNDIKLHSSEFSYGYCKEGKESFSLSIDDFNTVEFTKTKCLSDRYKATLRLSASIDMVLSQGLNRFQTVALVEGNGLVRSIVNNRAMLTKEPELYLNKISSKVFSQNAAKLDDSVSLFGTHFEDITLDRNDYRVYVHPIVSRGLSADKKEYFLVGLVNKQLIVTEKLKLPSEVLMWLILALLLFIACTPLLKLRFVSATYAIQRGDKSQIILGLIIAVGILSIGLSQQLFQGYLVSVKEEQLKNIHKSIVNDAKSELIRIIAATNPNCADKKGKDNRCEVDCVTAPRICESKSKDRQTLYFIDSFWKSNRGEVVYVTAPKCDTESKDSPAQYVIDSVCKNNRFEVYDVKAPHICKPEFVGCSIQSIIDSGWQDNIVNLQPSKKRTFLETAIYLDGNGKIQVDKLGEKPRYASSKLVLGKDTDLSHREYFKRVKKNEFWSFGNTKLFLQRIFNIEDGRLNSVIAYPVKSAKETKTSNKKPTNDKDKSTKLKVVGARISSLVDRVLPKNFGFAVIDSQGDVIYHSTDSLSLVENFYTEINQDPLAIIANNHRQDEVINFDVVYKGAPHKIAVGPLFDSDESSPVPWNLVVFFDPSEVHTNNMILVFVAVLLYLLLIIPSFLVCRYLLVQKFWQDICYYDVEIDTRYYTLFTVFAVSMVSCVISLMGIVHSLLARLTLWGLACVAMMFVLCSLWRLNYSAYFGWYRPKIIASLILIPFFLLTICVDWRLNYDIILLNWQSAIVGGITLLAVSVFTLYRLQFWNSEDKNKSLFSPKADTHSRQRKNRQRYRFPNNYPAYLAALVFLAAATPATIITYSAHEYLLERQANFEEDFLRHSFRAKSDDLLKYMRFISEKEDIEVPFAFPRDYESLTASFVLETAPRNREENTNIKEVGDWNWFIFDSEHSSSTDKLFDLLFNSTFDGTDFVSHLTYEAKLTLTEGKRRSDALHYRTDNFMVSAVSDQGIIVVILCMLLFLFVLFVTMRQLIVRRLMGEHLQDQYRVRTKSEKNDYYATSFPDLTKLDDVSNRRSQLILNTTRALAEVELNEVAKNKEIILYQQQVFRVMDCLDKFYSSEEHLETFFFLKKLRIFLNANKNKRIIVAISALEQISLDISLRKDALELLYEIHKDPKIRLVIVAETAPLYRILTPKAYQPNSNISVDIDEKTSWTKLYSEFDKHYAWSPVCKKRLDNPFAPKALYDYEVKAWPEMRALKDKYDSCLLREPEQVIEYMLVHAGPIYRRKWEECTINEKVILWRIANGASINPESTTTIERLMRRCYLYRDKGWSLINESFRQFILTAESEATMREWLDNTDVGMWTVLRVPIFALLLVLVAVFVYSSGSSLDTFLGIATATLGLIPLLIKNISLLRGGTATDIE